MKPLIYVSHATAFNYQEELYLPIRNANLNERYEFILPHEKSREAINSKDIISKANALVAEISYPSTGQGIELGWANVFNIPVICFYKKGHPYSSSLKIITQKIFAYQDHTNLLLQLNRELTLL